MIDLGEHIEEMAKLYKENGLKRDPAAIAQDVLDIACDQGLLTEAEASSELAQKQVTEQASYLLGVPTP
jgi:2-polyprenyl-3-methyl-5-hydroxy-6-metoxy-1,4-benzoquinol methylase